MLVSSAAVTLQAGYSTDDLIKAAREGKSHNIKRALRGGVSVNATDAAGNTALHYAAQRSSGHGVKLLIDENARRNVLNKAGQTPLDLASRGSEAYKRLARAGGKHAGAPAQRPTARRAASGAAASPAGAAAASRYQAKVERDKPQSGESWGAYQARIRRQYPRGLPIGYLARQKALYFAPGAPYPEPAPEVEEQLQIEYATAAEKRAAEQRERARAFERPVEKGQRRYSISE